MQACRSCGTHSRCWRDRVRFPRLQVVMGGHVVIWGHGARWAAFCSCAEAAHMNTETVSWQQLVKHSRYLSTCWNIRCGSRALHGTPSSRSPWWKGGHVAQVPLCNTWSCLLPSWMHTVHIYSIVVLEMSVSKLYISWFCWSPSTLFYNGIQCVICNQRSCADCVTFEQSKPS